MTTINNQDMDIDENQNLNLNLLKLPQKHLLLLQQVESKRMKLPPTAFFSELNEEQLTTIFGEGLRFQFGKVFLKYDSLSRDHMLFGTLQVAPDFSPDPLLQQNAFFDVFNREFDNSIHINTKGYGELPHFSCTSFPVSSTSVLQITAKLYVATDKPDDAETYSVDHVTKPTVCEAIDQEHLLDEIYYKEHGDEFCDQMRNFMLQHEHLLNEPFHNEAFHVCDDRAFINISSLPYRCGGELKFNGKDGSVFMSYSVFKYAVDADLEVEFSSTKHKNVTGNLFAIYPAYGDKVRLFESHSSTTFITPGKMNLIRSELAVPAHSCFMIEAVLHERTNRHVNILKGRHIFHVPRYDRSSIGTIKGDDCSLELTVNWKLPYEEPRIPSSPNPSVSRRTERRRFGAHSTPTMADPDERNRWSLQEEIAKVFNVSLKRTFSLQEAVPYSIYTCTKEDGGDYLCSSVLHIWPEIKNTYRYKGPKHAGMDVKDDIMGSDMMERCVVCGPGFVKFKLCRKWIAKSIHTMLTVGIESWAPKLSVKNAVIYFSSRENGFLRATCIGETIALMLEYSGVAVLRKRIVDRVSAVSRNYRRKKAFRRRRFLLGIDVKEEDKSLYKPYTREILDLFREKGLPIGNEGDELPLADLTVLWHALKEEKADLILDVSDVGERVRIERCIAAAKHAGLIANDHSEVPLRHLGYCVVQHDLIDEEWFHFLDIFESSYTRLLARQAGMVDEWIANECRRQPHALAYDALKYAYLKTFRLTDFKPELYHRLLNDEENTAVYLKFTHVRVCSIIEGIKELRAEALILKHDDERELGLHLLRFTEVLGEVCSIFAPHIMCDYLYGLCKKFNSLESSVWQVVGSSEETNKLLLCKATELVMRKCFEFLGITPIRLSSY